MNKPKKKLSGDSGVVTELRIRCSECGSTDLTKSGSNSWRVICKNPVQRVRVQRWLCGSKENGCGKYSFSMLDGSPLPKINTEALCGGKSVGSTKRHSRKS